MRYKILNKGSLSSVIFGVSENKEKSFKKTYICIEKAGVVYKVLSLLASKKDASISVFFDYCKEKKAYVWQHKHKYKPGPQFIDKSQITDEFEIEFDVDKMAKLSLHQSGFVQLSGKGILSGIDSKTGIPKGVGVFSSPLQTPVSSGPTFNFGCWGLEKGFDLLLKKEPHVQYLILKGSDFEKRYIKKDKMLNSYILEFFIFPKEANKYVYDHDGQPYINQVMNNYLHAPGALFAHPVADISFFDGVIGVFPVVQWTEFAEETECGYLLDSPGGSNNQFDKTKSGYNFHLICPMNDNVSSFSKDNIKSLAFKLDQQ